jgi:outer membrane protein TolC
MMEIYKRISGFALVLVVSTTALAQDVLSIDEAIDLALKNNFDIRIAKNQADMERVNNTIGIAGFLPTINLNGTRDFELNDTRQEFFTGEVRSGSNVRNNSAFANAALEWTFFSGMRILTTKKQLDAFEEIGETAALVQMENTVTQVIAAYYDLLQKQKQMESIRDLIVISIERKYLADQRLNIGTGSGLMYFQSAVDLNTDSASLLRQEFLVVEAKVILNELLARDPNTEFEIDDEIILKENLNYPDLEQKLRTQNRELILARRNLDVAEMDLKLSQSTMFPEFGVLSTYSYQRSESEIGFLQSNQTNGLAYGLTARWTIFDGLNNRTRNEIARVNIEQNLNEMDQVELRVRSELFKMYTAYEMVKQLFELEQKNVEVARQTLEIATEQMRLGIITALDLRLSQVNLIQAEFRLIQTGYELKLSETELIRLSCDLIN